MSEVILIAENEANLEYDFSGIKQIGSDLYKGLSLYAREMSVAMKNAFADLKGEAVGFNQNKTLNKYIKETGYLDLVDIPLPVPRGLNTKMLNYIDALSTGQVIVDKLMEEVLKPSYTWFSKLLASPEYLNALDNSTKVNLFIKERESAIKELSKCFIKNDRVEYMKYGDLYSRNEDFLIAQERYENISERLLKTPPALVREKVEEICSVIDKLALRLRQDPEAYATNGITAKKISELTYNLAQLAEFYAGHFIQIEILTSILTDSNLRLAKFI